VQAIDGPSRRFRHTLAIWTSIVKGFQTLLNSDGRLDAHQDGDQKC